MSVYETILEEEYQNKVALSGNMNPDIDEEELPLVDTNSIEFANATNMLFF